MAARSRGGEKVEGLADTCFRQILGHRLPDEERRSLGPVAVVGQDIGEVLGLDIDGHQGDIGGYPAEELGQSRPLAVDVGGEIDFVDRRWGQDGQSVGPACRSPPPESPRHRSASRRPAASRRCSACGTACSPTGRGSSFRRADQKASQGAPLRGDDGDLPAGGQHLVSQRVLDQRGILILIDSDDDHGTKSGLDGRGCTRVLRSGNGQHDADQTSRHAGGYPTPIPDHVGCADGSLASAPSSPARERGRAACVAPSAVSA